jgi:hypothetical protein
MSNRNRVTILRRAAVCAGRTFHELEVNTNNYSGTAEGGIPPVGYEGFVYNSSGRATSSLDSATAERFKATISQLKGRVTMFFITHAVPKNLQVDEIMRISRGTPGSPPDRAPDSVNGSIGVPA